MANDISLLKLSSSAQLNKAVNLACLPKPSGSLADGKMCWVTGKIGKNKIRSDTNLKIRLELTQI